MTQHYLDLHKSLAADLPGAHLPWLQQRREEGLARFAEIGFPRNEAWKYTQLALFARRAFHPAAGPSGVDEQTLRQLGLEWPDAYRLVFIDGHYVLGLSKIDMLPEGVVLGSLAEAYHNHPRILEQHLGCYTDLTGEGLSALNTAFMQDGFFLNLSHGIGLEQPVHVVFLSSTNADGMAQPRNLIVAEAGSRAKVIEHYAALGEGTYFTNTVTEVAAHADSHIEHFKLQEESAKTLHVAALGVHQAGASRFDSHVMLLGGQLTRNAISTALDAEGAECNLYGLYLLEGRQHADNHTRVEHRKPSCASKEYYKGVLGGHARGIFSGRVLVAQDAQHTDSQQTNHNLLLSEDAEADARPQLEIYADDVKCSHGATVGQLDETAMFYLRSRGIDQGTARNLLIYAFAEEVLDFIKLPGLHEQMRGRLIARLPESERIRQLVA